MLFRIVLIGIAGGFGALSRHGLSSAIHYLLGKDLPWGTMLVNIIGCFLFGLVTGLFSERFTLNPEYKAIILTGFMGAFTTFSTYMYETHTLLDQGLYAHAIGNLAVQNIVGLLAVVAGLALSRALPVI